MVDFSIAMLNYQRVTYEIIFFWGNKDPWKPLSYLKFLWKTPWHFGILGGIWSLLQSCINKVSMSCTDTERWMWLKLKTSFLRNHGDSQGHRAPKTFIDPAMSRAWKNIETVLKNWAIFRVEVLIWWIQRASGSMCSSVSSNFERWYTSQPYSSKRLHFYGEKTIMFVKQ